MGVTTDEFLVLSLFCGIFNLCVVLCIKFIPQKMCDGEYLSMGLRINC